MRCAASIVGMQRIFSSPTAASSTSPHRPPCAAADKLKILCIVLRGTTTSPMTQNITSRCALYTVSPSARTAGVDPTRGPTASGIGCAPRARVSEVAHGGLGRGSTVGLGPRNYARNLAPPSCQVPRSNCVKRILPVGPMHSCVLRAHARTTSHIGADGVVQMREDVVVSQSKLAVCLSVGGDACWVVDWIEIGVDG